MNSSQNIVEGSFMFGKMKLNYTKKEVDRIIDSYEDMLSIQKRDIEYLKKDNQDLKNTLFELSAEISELTNKN